MEQICLKAGSVFHSEAFEFIKAEKCNIQIIFENVNGTLTVTIQQILSSRAT